MIHNKTKLFFSALDPC